MTFELRTLQNMNKNFFTLLLLLLFLQKPYSQNKSDVLIIDPKYEIAVSSDKIVKEINVPRGFVKKTKKRLIQQCIDSTKFYNGNCFIVTYYNDNEFVTIKKEQDSQDYIRGKIYTLNKNEIHIIKSEIENYNSLKVESKQIYGSNYNVESSKITYEVNFVFQYGGESKLTLLPKINLLRKHKLTLISPFYGLELGIHPLFVAGAYSFSGICGIEKGRLNLETSVSHFRTTKIRDEKDGYNGPFSQNLLNVKLGYKISKVRIKVGRSFLLNEIIPQGQKRIGLIDLGKINDAIYGIEIQFK